MVAALGTAVNALVRSRHGPRRESGVERMARENYIKWTDEERSQLVAATAALMVKSPRLSPLMALRQAMAIRLPADRRREILALSVVPWFLPAITEFVQKRDTKPTETVPVVTPAPPTQATPPTPAASPKLTVIDAIRRDLLEAAGMTVDYAIDLLIARLVPVLVERLGVSQPQPAPVPKAVNEPPPTPPKPALPRVLIYGLLSGQRRDVTDTIGDRLKLHFASNDSGVNELPQAVDRCFVVTKFANHSTTERLAAKYGHKAISNHYGGIYKLKQALIEFAKLNSAS